MCSIFTLPPGINIDEDKLDCVVANNWHGYGVVLHDTAAQRLEVRRHFSEEHGADPEHLARVLKDNDDVTRYVHVRHTTAGENGLDNCHPFPVYASNSREVYLMHNGTIYDYKPKAGDTRNDSRIFCEEFVSDLLVRFEGDMGRGDYNHPLIKTILSKQIGTGLNRLLIVSNDLDPLMIGDWTTIKNKDGSEFRASNNEYFNAIKRGPRYTYVPFRHTQQGGAVVPYGAGTNLKTQSTGQTTASNGPSAGGDSSANVVARLPVSRSPAQQETKTLVEEAKEARAATTTQERSVVPLSEVEQYKEPQPYSAPPALLEALGISRKMFEDYGFDCLVWMREEELTNAVKQVSPVALGELLRALVEIAQEQATELDLADQTMSQMADQIQKLERKHKAASLKIEELQQTAQPVRKVG